MPGGLEPLEGPRYLFYRLSSGVMDHRATKDTYERETEEAERLVRTAPKVKPSRHDKKREDMRPDFDPDIEGDKDIARDPDMSMNYKDIGGSVVSRVMARFLRADAGPPKPDAAKVKVKKKDTGWVGWVGQDKVKEDPAAYEVVEEEKDDEGEEPKPPPPLKPLPGQKPPPR